MRCGKHSVSSTTLAIATASAADDVALAMSFEPHITVSIDLEDFNCEVTTFVAGRYRLVW